MTTPLSPAAQAVWGAFNDAYETQGPLEDMGCAIALLHVGVWRDQTSERIETDGCRAFAWMPLPDLPNAALTGGEAVRVEGTVMQHTED